MITRLVGNNKGVTRRLGITAMLVGWLVLMAMPAMSWGHFPFGTWERDYPNLVFNPSFERAEEDTESDHDYPDDWQEHSRFTHDNSTAYDGSWSWRVDGSANGFTYQSGPNHTFKLIGNTEYKLSAYIRTSGVSGDGLWVTFQQLRPNSFFSASTPKVSGTQSWTKVETTFTTPSDHVDAQIRLQFNVTNGGQGWFDLICIEPTSGVVPYAAAPVISPNGGIFSGPVDLTMSTTTPNASIRWTADGREPRSYCRAYEDQAFPFFHSGTIRAITYHSGYRRSPETQASFTLNPVTDQGVPFYSIDWEEDVYSWWQDHPLNPASSNYVPPANIVHPTNEVTLGSATQSALQGAIDSLDPQTGGTIFLPEGTYDINGEVDLRTHNNVHLIAQGAVTLRKQSSTGSIMNIRSCAISYQDHYTDFSCINYPISNIYLEDIIFDCNFKVGWEAYNEGKVTHFAGVNGVMYESCDFLNVKDSGINAHFGFHAKPDRVYFRNCYFDSDGQHRVIYFDGTYGTVLANCLVDCSNIDNHIFTMHINNDMVHDSATLRCDQYCVFYNNTLNGGGMASTKPIVTSAYANCMFIENDINGPFNVFLMPDDARYRPMVSEMIYETVGNMIIDNDISDIPVLLDSGTGWYGQDRHYFDDPRHVFRGNVATGVDKVISTASGNIDPQHEPKPPLDVVYPASTITEMLVEYNEFSGTNLPQFVAQDSDVTGFVVQYNTINGSDRSRYTGFGTGDMDYSCNTINGVLENCCTVAPDAPTGLTVETVTEDSVALSWTASGGCVASVYNVYRNGGSSPVDTTSATSYTDSGLTGGMVYTYTVSGENSYGESPQSSPVTATTLVPDTEAPDVPTGVTIDAIDYAQATLSWLPAEDNIATTGYRVFRNSSSIGTTATESYTDDTVGSCATYSYTVTAFDASANESGQSDPAVGTTGSAPQDADLVADGVVDQSDLAVMAGNWLDTTCGIPGDLDGNSVVDLHDVSLFAVAWTGPDSEAPTIPTGLVVDSVTDTTVALDWADAADNVAVTGYRVFRDSSSVGTTAGSAYTDSGLVNETAYTYTVSAFDAAGNESGESGSVVATTQTPVTNLLLNGSFETGGTWPDNWSSHSSFSWDSVESYTGSRSLKVTLTATGDPYVTQNNVDLTPDQSYTISAWMKAESIVTTTNPDMGLSVRWANLGGGSPSTAGTYDQGRVSGTSDWGYKEKSFTPTGGTGAGRVDCQAWMDSGTGWFDAVVVEAD